MFLFTQDNKNLRSVCFFPNFYLTGADNYLFVTDVSLCQLRAADIYTCQLFSIGNRIYTAVVVSSETEITEFIINLQKKTKMATNLFVQITHSAQTRRAHTKLLLLQNPGDIFINFGGQICSSIQNGGKWRVDIEGIVELRIFLVVAADEILAVKSEV